MGALGLAGRELGCALAGDDASQRFSHLTFIHAPPSHITINVTPTNTVLLTVFFLVGLETYTINTLTAITNTAARRHRQHQALQLRVQEHSVFKKQKRAIAGEVLFCIPTLMRTTRELVVRSVTRQCPIGGPISPVAPQRLMCDSSATSDPSQ
jgi:hypothetical protein